MEETRCDRCLLRRRWRLSSALPASLPAKQAPGPQLTAQSAQAERAAVHGYPIPRTVGWSPGSVRRMDQRTTTPLTRPNTYEGDKLALSDEEVARIEGDPHLPSATRARMRRRRRSFRRTGTKIGLKPDTLDECRSGSTGAACGYNAFWTDPGDRVMRVNGQGRTIARHLSRPMGRMPVARGEVRDARVAPN